MDTFYHALLVDLDGTVYHGSRPVPGAATFLRRAAEAGLATLFVTNRSTRTPEAVSNHLEDMGIPCPPESVLTSSQATVAMLEREAPGAGVFFLGEDGLARVLEASALQITSRNPDYVVVGFDRGIDYAKIERASRLVRGGAILVATNPDRVLNTESGLSPGNGALVAAIATASGVKPRFVGKPEPAIFQVALERLGRSPERVLVVGDNLETDIAGGARAGLATALLLTGVSTRADLERAGPAPKPDHVVEDYVELGRIVLGGGG